MEAKFSQLEEICLVELSGNLLSDNQSEKFKSKVEQSIEKGTNRFLVDLAELKFMNSSGIKLLLQLLTTARNAGGEIMLCNINESISQVLLYAKLNSIFLIEEDRESAIKQLQTA